MTGEATDLQRVAPFFQPLVAVDDRQVVGYEVLGRYLTPTGPASLGPWFRDSTVERGRRLALDDAVLMRALTRAGTLNDGAWLFLNLAPERLDPRAGDPPDVYERVLAAGIDPAQVVLEVDEGVVAAGGRAAETLLKSYRQAGFRIACDKVGSGATSLWRLAALGPDLIKIDRNLVGRAPHRPAFRVALDALARTALHIGADLVVQGVETDEELAVAVEVGARYVQGYRFAPALAEFVGPHRYTTAVARGVELMRARRWRELRAQRQVGRLLAGLVGPGRRPAGLAAAAGCPGHL